MNTDRQWSKQEACVYVFFCLVFAMPFTYLFICALWSLAGKRPTSWLSFVVSYCEFVTFRLVSWVRRGTWLYRYLIFAPLLTLLCRCDSGVAHRHSQHQARHWEGLLTSGGLQNVNQIQHAFSKPSLVNLISKDANLVFYLSVYQLFHSSN